MDVERNMLQKISQNGNKNTKRKECMPQINIENPCITHRCSACCEAGTLIRLTQEEMHFLRQFGTQLIRHYEVLGGWASEPLW